VKILKFKLIFHIAAVTIPHSDKPSLLYINRHISKISKLLCFTDLKKEEKRRGEIKNKK